MEDMELFGAMSLILGVTAMLAIRNIHSDGEIIADTHRRATYAKRSLPDSEEYDKVGQLMDTLVNVELPALLRDRELIEEAAIAATENRPEILTRLQDVNDRIKKIPYQLYDLEAAALMAQTGQPSNVEGAMIKIREQLTSERALRLSAENEADRLTDSQLATPPTEETEEQRVPEDVSQTVLH